MRMIRLALITVFVIAFSLHSQAEVKFSAYSRMISYEQLMKLSPEKREAYVEELRILMLEMEELQTRRAQIDPQLRARQTSMLDAFREFLAGTEALGAGGGSNRSCMGPVFVYVRNGRSVSCVARANADPRKIVYNWVPPAPTRSRPAPRMSRAPAGSQLFSTPLGYSTFRERYPELYGDPPRSTARMSRIEDPLARAARSYAASSGQRSELPDLSPEAFARQERAQRRAGGARRGGRSGKATASDSSSRGGAANATPGGSAASPVKRTESNLAAVPIVQLCTDAAAGMPASTGLVCSRDAISQARVNFDGKEQRNCIYAGFIREYREGIARPGQCVPIHQWCIPDEANGDTEDCRERMDPAYAKTPVFSCNPSQVLCNPMLFGVKKGQGAGLKRFEAYCVPKAGAATKACYDLMHENLKNSSSETPHIDLMARKDSGRENIVDSMTPEEKTNVERQLAQMKTLWDDLAAGLHAMCIANPDLQAREAADPRQVFCEECHYIRERLHEMAALAKRDDKASLCQQDIVRSSTPLDAPAPAPAPPAITASSPPTTEVPAVEQATLTPAPGAAPVPGAATTSQ